MKAFPTTKNSPNGIWYTEDGMDLRDYFAAKAMQGLIASPKGLLTANKLVSNVDYAEAAYSVADAMMKARQANGK